ncbi:hypothetical protein BDV10DRAFT_183395 [Aspergillus recurvatus]
MSKASAAVFCPQNRPPRAEYLQQLRRYMHGSPAFTLFIQAILDLPKTWALYANTNPAVAAMQQGPLYLEYIADWITHGNATPLTTLMSGIVTLPLLTIIQIAQYFQYLDARKIGHADFLLEIKTGGAQGFCGGLLPAMAIAASRNENEVLENAAKVLRIALFVGVCGELGDDPDVFGPTTLVLRPKYAGQVKEIVARYPGTYISAVTDPLSISIVGPVKTLSELKKYAEGEGLSVTELHLRGKVHNPENRDLCKELCALCHETPEMCLPDSSALQVPVRSNKTGQLVGKGISLTEEVVETALVSCCEWYNVMSGLAEDLQSTGESAHTVILFGTGRKNCVPAMPFEERHLEVNKVDVVTYIESANDGPRLESFPEDTIAIVGAACRLPGARSLDELWELVSAGRSCVEPLPLERLDPGCVPRLIDSKEQEHTWYGNFIDDVQAFDNAFFGISPRESSYMDPQQRLLLEAAYEALDSSGYLRSHNREDFDNVGCFLGSTYVEYLENTISYSPAAYAAPGTIRAFQSGRISYHFGWSGPSEVVDTACSSSLVAIHRACRAIQAGECPMALAGGVNIITGIHNYIDLGKAGFLSPSGQCKPFDAAADGYCRADGLGLVVLKSLRQAVNDGDHVLGVIPAVATNHGGLSPSITVPYSRAQTSLFRRVLDQSRLSASDVSYVETHGTGTQVGDPIEMGSVREVLGGSQRHSILNIGSIKANVGHSETAAGVASLLKVLTMIQNTQIPPLAGFRTLNPKIPAIEPDNIRIPSETIPWNTSLRAALVNSYGAAGSNSALICCEPPRVQQAKETGPYPVFISATTLDHLSLYAAKLLKYIRKTSRLSLANLAFTLRERRQHHPTCWTGVAHDLSSLALQLENSLDQAVTLPSETKPVVMVFSGQSKQTVQLDRAWYDRFPRFRHYLDKCNEIVTALGHPAILPAVFEAEPLSSVVVLQCGTFAVQYACARCWIDAGVPVQATVGHSFGELTALAVSGVLSLEDAVKLVAARALLMETKWGSEHGTMLAVHTTRDTAEQVVAKASQHGATLEIACFNGPRSQVLVGSLADIETAEKMLHGEGHIQYQRVNVSHGFHSVFTESILEDLGRVANELAFKSPSIPVESCTQQPLHSVTSDRIAQHTRTPVYFGDAIARLEERLGQCIWLEAGSDSPIIPMTKKAIHDTAGHVFLSMKANKQEDTIGSTTTSLWREGIPTTFWSFLSPKESNIHPIWLPPYQFQRTKHWLDHPTITTDSSGTSSPKLPPTPTRLVTPRRKVSDSWASMEFTLHTRTKRFTDIVSAHAVRGQPLCPASMYMEAAVMAVHLAQPTVSVKTLKFQDLAFQGALGINHARDVELVLDGAGEYLSWRFSVRSGAGKQQHSRMTTHATGRLTIASQPDFFTLYTRVISDRIQSLQCDPRAEKLLTGRAYALFSRVVEYADLLRGIAQVSILDNHAVAQVKRPVVAAGGEDESTVSGICDAVQLDTFIQVVGLLVNSNERCPSDEAFIATHIDSIVMHGCDAAVDEWTVYAMASVRDGSAAQVSGDMFVFANGELVMTASGVQFTRYPIPKLERLLQVTNVNSVSGKPAKSVGFVAEGRNMTVPGESASDPDGQTLVASAAHKSFKAPSELDPEAFALLNQLGPHLPKHRQSWKDTLLSLASACDELVLPEDPIHTDPFLANRPNLLPSKAKTQAGSGSGLSPSQTQAQARARQRLLELISENSGGGVDISTGNGSMLQDLGIDSLSIIELQGALEEVFGEGVFGDEGVQLQSTVGEVLEAVAVAVAVC